MVWTVHSMLMQPSQEISSIWPAQFDFKSTWQANADGPYSSTIMPLTPTTKQETQTTPWKFHKDTTVYIAHFLYCQYQHCHVQYYVCVALRSEDKMSDSLPNGILWYFVNITFDWHQSTIPHTLSSLCGRRMCRCRRCASFLAASSSYRKDPRP